MSAPHRFAVEAQNFKYGFLTAEISSILAKGPGQRLDHRSLKQLTKGMDLLNQIKAGAMLVKTGESEGMASASSVELLGHALQHLTTLQEIRTKRSLSAEEKLIEKVLSDMTSILSRVIYDKKIPSRRIPHLELARRFFNSLSEDFVSSLGDISQPRANVPE